ncbi:uncharacterized protein Bfra_012141 [Botrytis fragariae]|uniref:Uncharacterized protein n=1 Tax=Botrytis fragariae TaxID=1964551 RepID=A0A8H6AJX1_9HELO|nr:uncharacterized protein Bfra_012141 [Botrytis fragariae]KAF5868809.1 hypothetical protein Bfra_012141 [Botrytis fragariae]
MLKTPSSWRACALYTDLQVSASNSSEYRAAHAAAVGQETGVWATAVFGKFNHRGLGRGCMHFEVSRNERLPDLRSCGWPITSHIDTIGRAAGFIALVDVDVYRSILPTWMRRKSAHFAEIILKIHLEQVKADADLIRIRPRDLEQKRHSFLEKNGCSSRFLPCFEAGDLYPRKMEDSINAPIPARKTMFPLLCLSSKSIIEAANGRTFEDDPRHLFPSSPNESIAKAISSLLEAASPSWCQPGNFVEEQPKELAKALSGAGTPVRLYAQYYILRSAYVTVMMTMPGELWPGLEDTKHVTALAYLA